MAEKNEDHQLDDVKVDGEDKPIDPLMKAPPYSRRDVPEWPFGNDATFLAYLPKPKAKTGGPIVRSFRTMGVIQGSDGTNLYRFPRGRWPILATKVDSEGKQIFRFRRDPMALSVSDAQKRQLEGKRAKDEELAIRKAHDEKAEREEAERKARIEAEARVKVEMEMKAKNSLAPEMTVSPDSTEMAVEKVAVPVEDEGLDLDLDEPVVVVPTKKSSKKSKS